MEKTTQNEGKKPFLVLTPDAWQFISEKFTSLPALKIYMHLCHISHFGKYKDNLRNVSTTKLAETFGFSSKQASKSLLKLEEMNLITWEKQFESKKARKKITSLHVPFACDSRKVEQTKVPKLEININMNQKFMSHELLVDVTCTDSLCKMNQWLMLHEPLVDQKSLKAFTALMNSISLISFLFLSNYSLPPEGGTIIDNLILEIKSKSIRNDITKKIFTLIHIFGLELVEKTLTELKFKKVNVLSIVDRAIDNLFADDSENELHNTRPNKARIMAALKSGANTINQLPSEIMNTLTENDLNFIRTNGGLSALSHTDNFKLDELFKQMNFDF